MIRKRHIPQRTIEQELFNAVQRSSTKNTEDILAKGIDPNKRYDKNPIFFDASLPNLRVLLEHGANINLPSSATGMTMLNHMCYIHNPFNVYYNHREHIQFLLEHGADPLLANPNGDTPLHTICHRFMDTDIVRLLLEHGADPNLQNNQGDTPLHEIAGNRIVISGRPDALPYEECIRILIEAGANPLLQNDDGQVPSEYAEEEHRKIEVIRALRQVERNAGSELEMPEEIILPPFDPNRLNRQNLFNEPQNMFNGGSRASGVQAFNGGSRASGVQAFNGGSRGRRGSKTKRKTHRRQAYKKRTHRRRRH